MAQEVDLARVGIGEAEEHAQRRGLARAVGAEEPVALALQELEVEAGDDLAPLVGLADRLRDEDAHATSLDTASLRRCSLRWKKCSPPAITRTGTSRGVAQAIESDERHGLVQVAVHDERVLVRVRAEIAELRIARVHRARPCRRR